MIKLDACYSNTLSLGIAILKTRIPQKQVFPYSKQIQGG